MPDSFNQENRPPDWYDPRHQTSYGQPAWRGRRRHAHSPSSGLLLAIFLIGAGALLFLDNIGVLPIHNIWDYWPAILIAVGVAKLTSSRYSSEIVFGVVLVFFGTFLLLVTLHLIEIHSWGRSWPFSLLLIGLGCAALVKAIESGAAARPRIGFPRQPRAPLPPNALNEQAVFGNVKRRFNNELFSGAYLHCVFGNIELDLRGARTDPQKGPVIVSVECVFGLIELRVPQDWKVDVQTEGAFGYFEDKTIPSTATQGIERPVLILTGSYTFGGIELKN